MKKQMGDLKKAGRPVVRKGSLYWQYLQNQYVLDGLADVMESGTVYRWGADARSYVLQSPQSSIRILKRKDLANSTRAQPAGGPAAGFSVPPESHACSSRLCLQNPGLALIERPLFLLHGNAGLKCPPCIGLKRHLLPAGNNHSRELHPLL
jgi:hypothetical protein